MQNYYETRILSTFFKLFLRKECPKEVILTDSPAPEVQYIVNKVLFKILDHPNQDVLYNVSYLSLKNSLIFYFPHRHKLFEIKTKME